MVMSLRLCRAEIFLNRMAGFQARIKSSNGLESAKSGRSVLAATDPKQDAHICCKQKVQWSNGGLTLRRTDGVEG